MKDATGGTTTGGTSFTLNECGTEVKNGLYVADTNEADFKVRTNITFRNRNPQLQSDGTYSKAKRSVQIVTPIELADGTISFCLSRIEFELHPEMSAAQITNLVMLAAQIATDSDVANFRNLGSLA
jgi:hypothetical protein